MKHYEIEDHASQLFDHWYSSQTKRLVIIWAVILGVLYFAVGGYILFEIDRANGWYAPNTFTLPLWYELLYLVFFIVVWPFLYKVTPIAVHKFHKKYLVQSFENTFTIVFESMEELNACEDISKKFYGVTREQKELMRRELNIILHSIPEGSFYSA